MIILLILTKVSLDYVFNVRRLEVITDYESACVYYGNEIQSKGVQIPGRSVFFFFSFFFFLIIFFIYLQHKHYLQNVT